MMGGKGVQMMGGQDVEMMDGKDVEMGEKIQNDGSVG